MGRVRSTSLAAASLLGVHDAANKEGTPQLLPIPHREPASAHEPVEKAAPWGDIISRPTWPAAEPITKRHTGDAQCSC